MWSFVCSIMGNNCPLYTNYCLSTTPPRGFCPLYPLSLEDLLLMSNTNLPWALHNRCNWCNFHSVFTIFLFMHQTTQTYTKYNIGVTRKLLWFKRFEKKYKWNLRVFYLHKCTCKTNSSWLFEAEIKLMTISLNI